jgi:hypothetical protein
MVLIYASLQAFRLGICSFVLISLSDNMDRLGSIKANGREPKTGFGRVFNSKLGCFDDVRVLVYADACPHLLLKTRSRFSPVSLSLSMDRHNVQGDY